MKDPKAFEDLSGSEIAIIGMAGRFPGARSIDAFWNNLRNGVESITFFTDEQLQASGVPPQVLDNPNYVKARAVLEDADLFDAAFFGFNPREAEGMDPQHRLFLECVWEAIETAGYDAENYEGAISVYAGASMSSYLVDNLYANPEALALAGEYQSYLSNIQDSLTTRIAYKLNLKGPCYSVQTFCSTSLVVVHLACQSLLNFECDMAVAGGVTVFVPQNSGYWYHEGLIVSPDGHCRAFDAKAQGTVFGNGLGTVVLKRFEDALSDGDHIEAVIKGSATNNDGSLKVSYTAPSVSGQAEVIVEALANADVEPETISYLETHGTATALGDPTEVAALNRAFRSGTQKKRFCAIGSVKSNVGHLDAAGGVAGLIKTVLALKHKTIPPSLHFQTPNPEIDFESSPFYVNSKLSEWKSDGTLRRAGVSSFGIGGTNAHVIVQEAPEIEPSSASRPYQLLVLSAKTDSALETASRNLISYFKQNPELQLSDAAYTLQVGRKAFNHRGIIVCRDVSDAVSTLETSDSKRMMTVYQERRNPPVAFMFSGQGAQYVNMGLELYRTESQFQEQVDLCSEILKPHLSLDLRDIIYPDERDVEKAAQELKQTYITQPALFTIEYALAKLWMSWGVEPEALVGHSIGEYVAACLAGVFTLEDALVLVATRGRLMQGLPGGCMLAVFLSEEEVKPLIGESLALAVINGPSICAVSGDKEAIEGLEGELSKKEVGCRRLRTSHAFHSKMMEPILEAFTEEVKKVRMQPPQVRFLSNVSGTWIREEEAMDAGYWARHLRRTVRFSDCVGEMLKEPNRVLLEVGPGQTLSTLVRQHPKKTKEQVVLSSVRHPKEKESDIAYILNNVGRLWLSGIEVDWTGFYRGERRHRLPLPTYPFERQRYWVEPVKQAIGVLASQAGLTTTGDRKPDIADWFYIPSWKRSLPPNLIGQGTLEDKGFCWLVFIDECGIGSGIVERLKQEGHDVISVIVGEQFSRKSDDVYTINPQEPDGYELLLKELCSLEKTPGMIVHLWNLTPNGQTPSFDDSHEIDIFEKSQNLGFYSLLFLAQSIGRQHITDPIQIGVVSNNMQEVTGAEVLHPEKVSVLGPCKVIPQEYLNITCRSIDIVLPGSGIKKEAELIDQLVTELAARSSDSVIAYRGEHRWVQTYEAIRLDEVTDSRTGLREAGVYLITGRLEGIGFALAEYLAQTLRARVILAGDSAVPAKEGWKQWQETHDDRDSVSRKIQKLKSLEDKGAEVMVFSVDVANEEQMEAVKAQAVERFGCINGIIYAAELAKEKISRSIAEIDRSECEAQFGIKVRGLFVLEKILQDMELDFCLVSSSTTSVLGGLGYFAYSAANLFIDAFVNKHNKVNTFPWVSVNWDGWQLKEGTKQNADIGVTLAKLSLTPKEGAETFKRVLSLHKAAQVIVSTGELQARIDQWINRTLPLEEEQSKKGETTLLHSRPNLSSGYVGPRNELEQTLVEIWQRLLGIEQVGVYDNFFELGGHSLLATQLMSRVREAIQVELPMRGLFESPVIADLAVRIEEILIEEIEDLPEEEAKRAAENT